MVSVRKRKMARSSVKKNTRRVKDKQRDINIYSNPIIAKNWDKSLTLKQNYKKLGLTSKLNKPAGGVEQKIETLTDLKKKYKKLQEQNQSVSIEDIENTEDPSRIPEGEARIVRDPKTNEVLEVIYGTMKVEETEEEPKQENSVIKELEEYASQHAKPKRERHLSERENEWAQKLYEKYGDDYDKMKWDKKLNIYQQSVGDLKRRIGKWKKANKIV
ncbi:NOP16 [Candida pseudojiufengensis]|uniref:NOP16 n=1 Tax=Candida pseudojiufengensis TaxID=497109 RepID=UPI0022259FA3|nr:NOP16 [Candida pseudojiufengensis]KAI5965342.1 NOP16 [Candida pseudojiufengensis]